MASKSSLVGGGAGGSEGHPECGVRRGGSGRQDHAGPC